MDVGPGRFSGDPLARSVGGGRAAVERGRQFEHDPGPASAPMPQIRGQLFTHRPFIDADIHDDAGGPQLRDPPAGHKRVGVKRPDDHTDDSGRDQRIGAGSGAALMSARFKRRVKRRPTGGRSRRIERDPLGVRTAGRLGGAVKRPSSGRDQHRTDPGIGRREAPDPRRVGDGALHPMFVVDIHQGRSCAAAISGSWSRRS